MSLEKVFMGSLNKTIPYKLMKQKHDSDSLAIILPGAGYSTQGPLLFYTSGIYYNKGFDILQINYSFSGNELEAIKDEYFINDVKQIIDLVLDNSEYKSISIIGKSIGTIALASLVKETSYTYLIDKTIWLTPLLQRDDVYEAMKKSTKKSLCIIGDNDPCYVDERYNELKHNHFFTLQLIRNADHSLSIMENPIESIEILKNVMIEVSNF
ncbi:alpha/beta hydrolase [Evansella sp. AB-P1]|uniref:alpha/beta hydrolase n=1 Tax=Evansella sp. AB-P1 TaxID=3037653 RepID=UPI00241CCBCD|nr:alpha/beta hydrolase [Evansella sp. AB-P1]MDG5788384.1 alpha/beta hydrolase [Evansella sp. AB-P1]